VTASPPRDFWLSSGFHLLDRDARGELAVSDEFIKAYLARPEIVPPPEACAAERALHRRLLAAPRAPVDAAEVAAIVDADARENWGFLVAFRDRLVGAGTVEAAYRAIVGEAAGVTPPLFMDQLVHLILRNALDGCTEAQMLRAAELFFRAQRQAVHEGRLLLADREVVDGQRDAQAVSPLVAMFGEASTRRLDVLDDGDRDSYFARSDAHDLALDFGLDREGRRGFASVVALWIRHLLALEVEVEALAEIVDEDWAWFIGLDAEATKLGNRLWRGETLGEDERARIVALFRLAIRDQARVLPRVGGRPIYLMLAMTPERVIRVKPQNLIAGLPLIAAPASA
jgi:hypothetical protein